MDMGDRSITLLEPHMHGDVHIGPKTVPKAEAATDDGTGTDETGPPSALVAVLAALAATAIAVAIAKKVGEEA